MAACDPAIGVGTLDQDQIPSDGASQSSALAADAPADKPLAPFQNQLLDIAFASATAIPVDPHIVDRSLAQDGVVATCLQLGQAKRALGYVEKIEDWRRGAGYADVAFYYAQHGGPDCVPPLLERAAIVASVSEDWRKDRITIKIARVHAWLGQIEMAAALESDVEDSESGALAKLQAGRLHDEEFDDQVKSLQDQIDTGHFDLVRTALETHAQLFNRFYSGVDRRSQTEQMIKTSWSKLPVMVRVELMWTMTKFALEHDDRDKALQLVNETQAMVEEYQWLPEDFIPLAARLARFRALAGDVDGARSQNAAAHAMFEPQRNRIANIYWAAAIRPVAETYQTLGDSVAALNVYKQVVEEGLGNTNSRPRAEDLTATCCSMALHGIEPDADLWSRIRTIRQELSDPW